MALTPGAAIHPEETPSPVVRPRKAIGESPWLVCVSESVCVCVRGGFRGLRVCDLIKTKIPSRLRRKLVTLAVRAAIPAANRSLGSKFHRAIFSLMDMT